MLCGTEVKSVRAGRVSLSDAYCYLKHGEIWLKNLHIAEYKMGGNNNHEMKRERKLLLTKREIKRIETKLKERGLTLIPIEIFINARNFVKVEIALAKGKKFYDKRDSIKQKDQRRDMDRMRKDF